MKLALVSALAATATALSTYSAGPTGLRTYAPGVNPPAHQRPVPAGAEQGKVVWAYTGAVTQGDAESIYNAKGEVTAEDLLNSPINHIAFIANVDVNQSTGWWAPGANNTGGCGQEQTFELPFGYRGYNKSAEAASLPTFQGNLRKLHSNGVTITLTLGSWCTELPISTKDEWTDAQFGEFVTYFEDVRQNVFGGYLDGIDFDWEGYCSAGCLKGTCECDWDDKICGEASPSELAAGIFWETSPAPGEPKLKKQCWIMPTSSTFQVMTGITNAMKKKNYVVTLVPMSTSLYSGEPEVMASPVLRNEYAKYAKHTFAGEQVDLLELSDGILLQWYSGFDATLCHNSGDPTACACNNVPDADYPNVLDSDKDVGGLLMASWQTYWNISGNMFPSKYPVRCQACGANVTLKDGTFGPFPCYGDGEAWYLPSMNRTKDGANPPSVVADHNSKLEAYVQSKKAIPKWWVEGQAAPSRCPRSIDCPDFQYGTEPRYSRQIKLLKSLQKVVDLSKISIGFETLAIDVQVQMESYEDRALPWTTASLKEHNSPTPYENYTYYKPCTQNMTLDNYKENKRCGAPLANQQWGPKFSAKDIVGLEAAVQSQLGARTAGIGMFTLDGCLSQPKGKPRRFWFGELMKLNETYKLPCYGDNCGSAGDDPFAPTPAPAPAAFGSYTVKSGDTCYSIADAQCQDGNDYATEICNAASVCTNLQVGATIKYDCSKAGAHC